MSHPNSAILLLFFVGVLSLVTVIIANVGGWRELATVYFSWDSFEGTRFYGQSARLRLVGYNNVLIVGVNAAGLQLAVFFPFRLAHPPLFIPWTDITAANTRAWFRNCVELRFARVTDVPVLISRNLAERIASEAGGAFRWEPGESTRP
jgi:hypothetical protein